MFDEAEKPTLEEDASNQELETTQPEPEAVQPTEEGKAEAEPLDGDVSEDQDQPTVELSSIAQALGLEVDDLDVDENGQVVLNAKIDGMQSKAKFKDSLATYQKQGHLDNRLREVNQREENLKAQETSLTQESNQRLQQFDDLNQVALSKLQSEYQSIDWNQLRVSDPAEFSAKQVEFQARNNEIQQSLAWVANQRQEAEQQNIAVEAQKLPNLIPEWKDKAVAEKEMGELKQYLVSNNINPGIANYADGMLLLKKAKAFDALNDSKPEIQKLVTRAPKVSKPGNQTKPVSAPKSDADYYYS